MNNTAHLTIVPRTAPTEFVVGTTYDTGRADYVWAFTVVARTAKFITIQDDQGKVTRVGVHMFNGAEAAYPMGNYSQCAVIFADRTAA